MEMKRIARIHTDFASKFGVPRQSGLVPQLQGRIVFEPEYRNVDAVRGMEDFSHLWLVWEFSDAVRKGWSPTVRPPRLGGNRRMGVFATRSPFRPNPIALSCVKFERIEWEGPEAPVIWVSGVDMMDGTPIYDIKPYLPYADSVPDAQAGFTGHTQARMVSVVLPSEVAAASGLPADKLLALTKVLEQDPRPRYQQDPERVYGMTFAGHEVRFVVQKDILYVKDIDAKGAESNELSESDHV